jgi:Xaa-Pro aminopeptidase
MPRNGDQFYPYRQNSDLFYLTGIEQPNTILLISSSSEILFIQQPNAQHALWEGDMLSKEKAIEISDIKKVFWENDFQKVLNKELKDKEVLYFNTPEKISQTGVKTKDEEFFQVFRKEYPYFNYNTIRPMMQKLRLVKEREEIKQIKQGIKTTGKAFKKILQTLKPGINEKELEALLRYEFLVQNSTGPAYDPIIASGKNACTLHYTKNNEVCQDGELLLMDIGAETNNYASDISRTVPVNGRFSIRQKKCYEAVLDVLNKTIHEIKPGIKISELNNQTKEWLKEKQLELGLYSEKDLEKEDLVKKYFPHSVSHFMGLDVHDYGDKETILQEGMVITCEPGLYIPEENIGIRIEEDILVGNPSVNLSEEIPKTIEEIENLMAG